MVGFETREGCQVPTSNALTSAFTNSAFGLKPENFRFWTARASPFCGGQPFASLSSSILTGLGEPGRNGGRTEPSTGYEFPPEYCYLKTKPCPSLAGLGVRSKRIVVKDINVYALGIYVDTSAARSALASYKKKPVADLERDQSFYDAVVAAPNVQKTLRIIISSRLVDRRKFLEALEERLAPRLTKAGEPSTMDAFRQAFDGVHFEKGIEISFVCVDNKKLVTQVAGQTKPAITSPALCSSLLDIYLGADPVSKEAKASFGRNLAASLKE